MTKTTNLESYKEKRKIRLVIDDLQRVEYLLDLIISGMAGYKRYKPVREVLSNVSENREQVRFYLKKYKEMLKEKNNEVE